MTPYEKIFPILLVSALLTGCGTTKQLQVVREVSTDTLYLNHIQYDSVLISQDRFIDSTTDTIYIRDISVQYRYKLLRGTVHIHQIDSIPVIREVEVIKTERYTPWPYRASLVIVIVMVVVSILYLLWKLK